MAFDREKFFAELVAAGEMDPLHLEIAHALFDEFNSRYTEDARWLAYIMATALDDHGRVEEPDINTGCANLISGMIDGIYTGRGLAEFFTPEFSAWQPARLILDPAGGDAESCANDAKLIYDALDASSDISLAHPPEVTELPTALNPATR